MAWRPGCDCAHACSCAVFRYATVDTSFAPRLLPEHEIADNSFENALLGPVVAHFYRVTGLMKDLSSDGNV